MTNRLICNSKSSAQRLGTCALAAIAFATVAPAYAQETSTGVGGGTSVTFEEIVVTAQKRAENLQAVPISITALTDSVLKNRDIDTLDAVDRISPNLLIVPSRTSTAVAGITLRGQVQDDPSSATLDQSVGLYVDGVYVARGNGAFQRLYDVERVEVLKGPQGTLYGRNTTGGAINVIPKHPTQDTSVDVKLTVGNYGQREAAAAVNIPLSESAAIRGVFVSARRDGYATNLFRTKGAPVLNSDPVHSDMDDQDSFYGRVILDVNPTENLKLSFTYDRYEDTNNGAPIVPIWTNPATPYGPLMEPLLPTDVRKVNQNDASGVDVQVQGVTAMAELDLGGITVKNIFAWRDMKENSYNDFDGTQVNLILNYQENSQHQYSNELNVSGELGDSIEWIAGGFYFKEKARIYTRLDLGLLPGFNQLYQYDHANVQNKSTAVFGQVNARLTDAFSITAGLRQTWETKEITSFNIGTNGLPLFPAGTNNHFSKDFKGLTGSISLNYKVNDDLFVYGKFGRGFRSGGFNFRGIGPAVPPFNKETVNEWEVGVKSDLAGGKLRVNAAFFYDKYDDIQRVIQGVFGDPPAPTTTTKNAAKATIYGGELEISALPTDSLELSVNIGAAIARYDSFMDGTIDKSFNRFPLVPDWTASGMVRYTLPKMALFTPVLQVDASWKDSYHLLVDNHPAMFQPSHAIVNAKVTLVKVADEDIDVSFFGKNIFDKAVYLNGRDFGPPFGVSGVRVGPPATYGIEVQASF